jgi:hypothetical protein
MSASKLLPVPSGQSSQQSQMDAIRHNFAQIAGQNKGATQIPTLSPTASTAEIIEAINAIALRLKS